jgi:hypothetical protein
MFLIFEMVPEALKFVQALGMDFIMDIVLHN